MKDHSRYGRIVIRLPLLRRRCYLDTLDVPYDTLMLRFRQTPPTKLEVSNIRTSVSLQQTRNSETAESFKNSLPDMHLTGARGQNGEPSQSIPVSRSPFRDAPRKNLLSPAYYGATARDIHSRRYANGVHNLESSSSNGLFVNAHSLSTTHNPSAYSGQSNDRLQPSMSNAVVGNSSEKNDFDEIDGSTAPLDKFNQDKIYLRSSGHQNEKGPNIANELELMNDGAIIISNALSHSKNAGEENIHSRVHTASLASLNRRNRPFSSMTSTSSRHCGKSGSDDIVREYPDPFPGGPSSFQQRLMDIAALENETLRWERLKVSRRKAKTYVRQD